MGHLPMPGRIRSAPVGTEGLIRHSAEDAADPAEYVRFRIYARPPLPVAVLLLNPRLITGRNHVTLGAFH